MNGLSGECTMAHTDCSTDWQPGSQGHRGLVHGEIARTFRETTWKYARSHVNGVIMTLSFVVTNCNHVGRKDATLLKMGQSADLPATMASELPSVGLVALSLGNISQDLSTGSIKQSCRVYSAAVGLLALLHQDQRAIRKNR